MKRKDRIILLILFVLFFAIFLLLPIIRRQVLIANEKSKTSHNIEETASAGAENGHNAAILGKKVQNSLPATTKSERMLVKMDIIELLCAKKSKNPSKNNYLYSKTRSNPSKVVTY